MKSGLVLVARHYRSWLHNSIHSTSLRWLHHAACMARIPIDICGGRIPKAPSRGFSNQLVAPQHLVCIIGRSITLLFLVFNWLTKHRCRLKSMKARQIVVARQLILIRRADNVSASGFVLISFLVSAERWLLATRIVCVCAKLIGFPLHCW